MLKHIYVYVFMYSLHFVQTRDQGYVGHFIPEAEAAAVKGPRRHKYMLLICCCFRTVWHASAQAPESESPQPTPGSQAQTGQAL